MSRLHLTAQKSTGFSIIAACGFHTRPVLNILFSFLNDIIILAIFTVGKENAKVKSD